MSQQKSIVIAGDVCIDWLSIPLDPASRDAVARSNSRPDNWQLQGGRRMYARHGGAWLTTHFAKAAAKQRAAVFGPVRLPQGELDAISPLRSIHSLSTLDRCKRTSAGEDFVLGVVEFEGFAGPISTDDLMQIQLEENAPADADVVVLDDAGNGFRKRRAQWPAAVTEENRTPLVIYKLRRPLSGDLGKMLLTKHASRTIVLLSADDMRAEAEGSISRALSWERTATDIVSALHKSPQLRHLFGFAHLIIPLGLEGVLYVKGGEGESGQARLWYLPDKTEGDRGTEVRGTMTGFASALAATLAVHLLSSPSDAPVDLDILSEAMVSGMTASWRLFDRCFGACKKNDVAPEPTYPGAEIFEPVDRKKLPIESADLHPYPRPMNSANLLRIDNEEKDHSISDRRKKDLADFRTWSILHAKKEEPFVRIAERIARQGVNKALPYIPMARYGKLELIERNEIESYRSIRNLIREFLKKEKPERPLSLAVFGAPGSGKSFGVVEIAKDLARSNPRAGDIERYDFNVSQWQSPADLTQALHHVRDSALRGNVPLVFFDEFDSGNESGQLGWLKFFLAPMQDGTFNDGAFTHLVGRAIFVFAGGTSASFEEFQKKADDATNCFAKVRDFLSRLRGYVNVHGIGSPVGVQLLRRALLLRSFLMRKCPQVIDPKTNEARVHASVLKAFLNVSTFHHGIRSMEAIFDMSLLKGVTEISASQLPPHDQLELHVPKAEFHRLAHLTLDLGEHLEKLAQRAHDAFVASQQGKRDPAHSSMQPWDQLIPIYKNSNREQAAHVPIKLAAIGCDFEPNDDPVQIDLTPEEIEILAKLEHERWMEERRPLQPDHLALIPWESLKEEDKEKDRKAVRTLPEQLKRVGLQIMRLE